MVDPRIERSRRVVRRAALAELAARGYAGLTIDAVSVRSGVARSTVYRHWPDKLSLVTDALRALNEQPGPAPEDRTGPGSHRRRVVQIVRHLAEAFRGSVVADCLPALIEGAEHNEGLREVHHRYNAERRQALVDAITAGLAAGEFRDGVDPGLASLALAGAVLYRRVMTAERFDPEAVERLVDLVLGGGTPPARPRGAAAPGE